MDLTKVYDVGLLQVEVQPQYELKECVQLTT